MSSEYLSKLIGKDTKYVVLAHLSETNNEETIAINEFKKRNNVDNLIAARQNEPTELIEV